MCSAKESDPREHVDAAAVGVFAWRAADGSPRGCAVTPYRIGEDAVVSSTLALLGKIHAVRRDPRVALLAGGLSFRGDASVELDRDGAVFDAQLRAQELRKFPPSRALLALPFHRRLLWWYVGRALVRISLETARPCAGDDRASWIAIGADGYPEIRPLSAVAFAPERLVPGERIELPAGEPDGPTWLHVHEERALLLVHEERGAMADLRQLAIYGRVEGDAFRVERREGSLGPSPSSLAKQLCELRRLAAHARHSRARLDAWKDPAP